MWRSGGVSSEGGTPFSAAREYCRTRAHLGVPQGTQAAEDPEVEGVCKARGNTECEPGDGLAGLVGNDAASVERVRLATAWLASREMTRQVRSECACRGS